MKLVKPYVKYVQNKDNYEHIAKAARICYASEAKGHNDYEFVENLWIKRNHRSPYRHGTLYYEISAAFDRLVKKFINSPYCTCVFIQEEYSWYISTNCQFVRELDAKTLRTLDNYSINLSYLLTECERYPQLKDIIRVSFEIQTQISTSRELNRVSPNNICEQSTRFCNFSNEKFGEDIAFCEPHWAAFTTYYSKNGVQETDADERIFYRNLTTDGYEIFAKVGDTDLKIGNLYPLATNGIPLKDGSSLCYSYTIAKKWIETCLEAEENYFLCIKDGMKPQDARGLLPLDVATKCFYTYSIKEWKHILDLRYKGTTGDPHPNAKIIATEIYNKLKELNLLGDYE